MAFDSYAPLYIGTGRKFTNDRIGFRLIWELCAHADPLGLSYPGLKRLAHHCTTIQDTIHAKLIEFSEQDIIRCHIIPRGYYHAIQFQVSPYAMFIRDEFLPESLRLWDEGKPYLEAFEMVNEINVVRNVPQPDFNQRKPTSNQSQNQRPNQTETLKMESAEHEISESESLPPYQPNGGTKRQKHAKGESRANSSTHFDTDSVSQTHGVAVSDKPTPHSAPPPPFDQPLPNAEMEMQALMLKVFGGGTALANARRMVWTHGIKAVNEAMQKARAKASANPMGYVVNTLRAQLGENPPPTPDDLARLDEYNAIRQKYQEREWDDWARSVGDDDDRANRERIWAEITAKNGNAPY